ncbi:nucleotidyl cyclase domain-containing protein [Streptomyces nondiastaticus]|uniref:Guanylate cyclase domain-containing protein n=1 Tax=Streptomyces nondiastaticus TaxID=3154512 RepID=A0ABW6U568_9ACTN
MAEPSNKTILLMDVEKSGGRRDTEQAVVRHMLYAVLHETLSAASIEPTEYRSEDRGDGVFVLIDPSVPKPALLRALLTTAPERLASNNRLASEAAQIRLRIVVHTGEVALDDFGAVGGDVVHAFRLLDSTALREALLTTPEPSVLCVSEAVYQGVVHHAHPGVRPEHFHPLAVDSKEGVTLTGWYHDSSVMRNINAPGKPRPGSVRRDIPGPPPSAPTLHANTGNFFFGTAHFGGDSVAGDKHVGRGTDR